MNRKLKSSKLWLTVYSCALLAYIVIANRTEFTAVAGICAGVIPVYMGVNVAQKKIYESKKQEE